MSDHWQANPTRDDAVTRALRGLYAPPADADYWDALERGIMARVLHAPVAAWWSVFPRWLPLGLAAAGISVILAGLAISSTRTAEARIAYETVVQTSSLVPDHAPVATPATDREATFRYLVSY
jgi:hypothetical protein